MSNELGSVTPAGFLPAVPSVEDLMQQLGGEGWDSLTGSKASKPLREAVGNAEEDLLRNYVQTFSTPAGQKVLEDLLDQSFRRGFTPPGGFKAMEETALYAAQRQGQNESIGYILRLIVIGRSLPSPAQKKAKKGKRK